MKSFSGSAKKSKGFSLLELLIAAALIAVGLLGLFFLVNRYNVKQAVATEVQGISQIAAETRTKFRAPGNFTGVTPQVLIDNGIINQSRVVAGTIQSEWSTVVGVVPVNLNGVANDGVSFNYLVPRESCSDFVSGSAGTFARIAVDGVNVKDIPGGAPNLDVAALGTQCDAGAGGNVALSLILGR